MPINALALFKMKGDLFSHCGVIKPILNQLKVRYIDTVKQKETIASVFYYFETLQFIQTSRPLPHPTILIKANMANLYTGL